jgi:hypothetical protein
LVPGVGERTLEERMAEFVAEVRTTEVTEGSDPGQGDAE